jgi:hypothetical protein
MNQFFNKGFYIGLIFGIISAIIFILFDYFIFLMIIIIPLSFLHGLAFSLAGLIAQVGSILYQIIGIALVIVIPTLYGSLINWVYLKNKKESLIILLIIAYILINSIFYISSFVI